MDILKNTEAMGKRIYEDLERINFIRTSTSEEETRAANIICEELAKAGMKAEIEEFMVETADIHTVALNALGRDWEVQGYRRSGSTPAEGLTARFAYVQQGTEADLYDKKGMIVLVNSGRVNEEVYERMVRYGVAAFLTWNGNVSDVHDQTDLPERELRSWATRYGTIPGGVLRAIDAMELVKGEPETVTFTLVQDNVERASRNVVLRMKGTDETAENITFGAHYDSVPFSHGVYDNGAGSAILMELARHYQENPPKRNLTFCWYGSEEVGLLGAKAYVAAHKEELKDVQLMINVDVAGSVLGADWAAIMADESLCRFVEYLSKEVGFSTDVTQEVYSSDSVPFANEGVPAINFCRFGRGGGAMIHCRHDVIDYLDYRNLGKTAAFVQTFADRMVDAVVFPVPRKMPENMVEAVDKYLRKKRVDEK